MYCVNCNCLAYSLTCCNYQHHALSSCRSTYLNTVFAACLPLSSLEIQAVYSFRIIHKLLPYFTAHIPKESTHNSYFILKTLENSPVKCEMILVDILRYELCRARSLKSVPLNSWHFHHYFLYPKILSSILMKDLDFPHNNTYTFYIVLQYIKI
jgi:hypothetical protein